ncbi:hypothetical protein DFH09DRAFT_874520, partial [Mycena vulgaris]
WPAAFHAASHAQVWCTYRARFEPCRGSPLSPCLSPSPSQAVVGWALGGTKGWTSDAGWGCMLRTAQSLGRVGGPCRARAPPAAPLGVHRMALAGKAAGNDVGMWFGQSAAASAVR